MRSNVTGVGSYNSEYRSFNRGYGRGHPRPFQSSQRQPSTQPNRKGDLFMEAGRLAVEYLVSNGLLPSNVLTGKFQNGTFRSSSGEFRDHRGTQDREVIAHSRIDSRPIGTARQAAVSPDRVSGTRRTPNDEDTGMSRNYSRERERRRFGASRSYSSDWSRENEREGSFSDRVTASQGMDAEDDKFVKGKSKDVDTDVRSSVSKESASNDDRHSEFEMGKSHHVDLDSKMTSSLQRKDEKKLPELSHLANWGCKETRDGTRNSDVEKEISKNDLPDQHCEGKNDTIRQDVDLLKLCPSAKIPTKVRSSLIYKSPKRDPLLTSEEKNDNEHNSIASIKDGTINSSARVPSSIEVHISNSVGMALSDQSSRDAGGLSPVQAVTKPIPTESMPFTEKTFSSEQKSDRGEKRPFEEENMIGEEAKKAKQWLSVAQSDGCSHFSDLSEQQSFSPAKRAASASILDEHANQGNFTNMSLLLKGSVESAKEQGEEKQLFANSFKICDLNLMQASDMHETRDMPVLIYPSISAPSKGSLVDVDLSMNNNCSLTNSYNDCLAARKDVEIIDLENGTLPEGGNTNASARNVEADMSNVGSFQNSSHNSNQNPDGQDGYGFMISELLGNDVPVQPDANSLQNEMGLHQGEGMFGEDDPIYMSLGEIPLSLLRVWDQSTQERNPFEM